MNYKALALGVALGFLFAAIPSCNRGKCGLGDCRGCCNGAGLCVNPGRDNACGINGTACVACKPGLTCHDNTCVQVGSPCGADDDCASLGQLAICKRTTSPYGDPYPGGYCTKLCGGSCPSSNPVDCLCPPSSACVTAPRTHGENDTMCWKGCADNGECREGYGCYFLDRNNNGCWLAPLPTPDAGPPALAGEMGGPCVTDDDCRNPPNDGFCTPERRPNGSPTGYIGGYCGAPCDVSGDEHCGPGGKCVFYSGSGAFCGGACSTPNQGQGDCRSGYVCAALANPDGGTASTGICNPNCNNQGAPSCGSRLCRPDGYCR